jgi:hypothetical protein
MKKSLIIILALVLVFAFSATALAATGDNAGDPYTSLTAGDLDPDLDEDLAGATFSSPNYFYDTAGTHELSVEITGSQGGDVVVIDEFGADLDDTYSPSATSANPATADMTFSLYDQTLYYTINFHVTRDTDTEYYSITDHFNVYVGSRTSSLSNVGIARTDGSGDIDDWDFSSGTHAYTIHVDQAVTELTFTPTKTDSASSLVYKKDGGADNNVITLNSGDTVVTIEVTAENTFDDTTYTFTVKRDYDAVSIAGMRVGSVEFTDEAITDGDDITYYYPYGSEEGDDFTFSFVDLVGSFEGEDAIEIGSDDDDVIEVSGDSATGFTLEFVDDPDGGDFDLVITVEALDGTELEFTLNLEEAEPVFLDDLDIMIGTTNTSKDLDFTMFPSTFDEETFAYYVFVPWDEDYEDDVAVYLKASFDDDDYTVECDTGDMNDGSFKNAGTVLDGDDGEFTVTITDEDDNYQDYVIYVFYGEEDADDDAALDDLTVKYGTSYKTEATLSPSFSSSTLSYTASLPLNTKSAKIILDLSDTGATVICNNEQVGSSFVVSGLTSGANTFKIVIMAEDYDTTKTYNLTINVGTGGLLTNLVFTPISGTLNVSPSFSGDVYNYVANVANGVSAIYVTPTAIDSSYTISVYKGASDYKTVVSGKTSSAITLNEGLNEIKVYVYKSGSSKTYTLSIYRQPATTKYVVSSQAITVNGVNKTLYAVNINGNNYLKLRDLAYMLSGTTKQFNVTFSTATNTAAITSLSAYVNDSTNPVNQPIVLSNPQLSSQLVTLNGKAAYPIAYNVAGSNYVNLRQICAMLDIGLTYSSATNTISITTANSYSPGL